MSLHNSTVAILAGGQGTRIRDLYPDTPKPLIEVAGKPFLEWVVRYWARLGAKRFVVSAGYKSEAIHAYLGARRKDGVEIACVTESSPLGTGGAARYAASAATGDPIVVVNGDSIVAGDLAPGLDALHDPSLDGMMFGIRVGDASRFGTLTVSGHGYLTGFAEKRPGPGLVNAGVYAFRRRLLDRFPETAPLSMELQVFPRLVETQAQIAVHALDASFLDIGTPQSLAAADAFIEAHSGLFAQ